MDLNWDRDTMTMQEAIRRAIARKIEPQPQPQPRMHAHGREAEGTPQRLLVRRRTIADAQAVAS